MKYLVIALLMASLQLVTSGAALAADAQYEQKQVVDFGEDSIEGDLTKPDGDMFDSRKRAKHNRLIRVRPHFRSEVLQSIRAL